MPGAPEAVADRTSSDRGTYSAFERGVILRTFRNLFQPLSLLWIVVEGWTEDYVRTTPWVLLQYL